MTQRSNVRPPIVPLTEYDARELLSKPLVDLCAEHGPTRVAGSVGCDEKTIQAYAKRFHISFAGAAYWAPSQAESARPSSVYAATSKTTAYLPLTRSEERRVGKEGVSTWR